MTRVLRNSVCKHVAQLMVTTVRPDGRSAMAMVSRNGPEDLCVHQLCCMSSRVVLLGVQNLQQYMCPKLQGDGCVSILTEEGRMSHGHQQQGDGKSLAACVMVLPKQKINTLLGLMHSNSAGYGTAEAIWALTSTLYTSKHSINCI